MMDRSVLAVDRKRVGAFRKRESTRPDTKTASFLVRSRKRIKAKDAEHDGYRGDCLRRRWGAMRGELEKILERAGDAVEL